MRILSMNHHIPCRQHTSYYTLLHLWLYLRRIYVLSSILLCQVLLESISGPHVALDRGLIEVLGLTGYAVVCQVHELVVDF